MNNQSSTGIISLSLLHKYLVRSTHTLGGPALWSCPLEYPFHITAHVNPRHTASIICTVIVSFQDPRLVFR